MRKIKKFLSYLSICTLGLFMTCSRQDVRPLPRESSEPGAAAPKKATQELPNIDQKQIAPHGVQESELAGKAGMTQQAF